MKRFLRNASVSWSVSLASVDSFHAFENNLLSLKHKMFRYDIKVDFQLKDFAECLK